MKYFLLLLCLAALASPMATNASAQDRMPPIPAERLTDAQKAAIEEFTAARGAGISGPFVPLLRSPEVMNRARALGDYLRFKSALPAPLSEFAILITAREWTQLYEWEAHHRLALDAGVSAETLRAVAEGRRPSPMSDDQAIVYDFATELHRNRSVSDATYARAVARFGEQGVVDMAGIAGYYTLLAMVMNTARTPLPAGRAPGLERFPR
jgi:4-carboxymuconolactone decarboxylase